MADQPMDLASHLYALAVAKDAANLIDTEAALALGRAAVKTLMALSPQAALLMRSFAEEEILRLSLACHEDALSAMAIVRSSLEAL